MHETPTVAEEERKPIGEVLPGLTLHPLQDSWTPLDAFVLIKSLDADGESSWSFRTTSKLNLEELLGELMVQTEVLRRRLVDRWEDNE
jgi:hypothetical protein